MLLVGSVEIEDMLEKQEAGEVTGSRFFPLWELSAEVVGMLRGAVGARDAVGVSTVL